MTRVPTDLGNYTNIIITAVRKGLVNLLKVRNNKIGEKSGEFYKQIQYIQKTHYNWHTDPPITHTTQTSCLQHYDMIHRLNNIQLDEKDYKNELNTIKYLAESNWYNRTIVNKLLQKKKKTENNKFITLTIKYIAVKNGYNPELINKLHKRILNTKSKTHQTNSTQPSKYITLTYYNSNTHKIANTFRKHNYKVAYRTNNTIRKHINNTNKNTDTYLSLIHI